MPKTRVKDLKNKINDIFPILQVLDKKILKDDRSLFEIFKVKLNNSLSFVMTLCLVIFIYYFYLYVRFEKLLFVVESHTFTRIY